MTTDDQWNQIRSDETRWNMNRLDNILFDHIRLDQTRSDDVTWIKIFGLDYMISKHIVSDDIIWDIMILV